jgi:hypothetical protein
MSFFKKLVNKKSNKKVVEPIVQLEEIPVVDSYQQEEIPEVINEVVEYENWDDIQQENNNISNWDNEDVDRSWSTNEKEISSLSSIERDNQQSFIKQSSSSKNSTETLTENKKSVNNKYLLELILLILTVITSLLFPVLCFVFSTLLLYRVYIIYPKLLLCEGDYIKEINPFVIQFSQSTICSYFQIGGELEDTIDELINGKARIEDFPMIQVCIIDDIFYSSDNRRLYCFQESIRRGLKVEKIPVKIRRVSDLNIDWKLEGSYKIIRNNNFKNIIISPYARNGRVVDEKGYWDYRED